MKKTDLKRGEFKPLYDAIQKPSVVDVPPVSYLAIDGAGDPNTSRSYADAVRALFAVAYALKFELKRAPNAIDFGVMPLEGLWWAPDMSRFSPADKSTWEWTMLIAQPALVTEAMIGEAKAEVAKKRDLAGLGRLRHETLREGKAAQILHVGPFTIEGPTIELLHAFVDARGNRTGKHHQIYLSDIRRADPAKWRTIIRQPFS